MSVVRDISRAGFISMPRHATDRTSATEVSFNYHVIKGLPHKPTAPPQGIVTDITSNVPQMRLQQACGAIWGVSSGGP